MDKFLDSVADRYFSLYGSEVGRMCFVFPNRRSSIFFRKYLGQKSHIPLLCPKLLTINDLFGELSNLEKVDKIEALWRLYRHYASLMWPGSEPKESFDEFVFWGDVLLNDFDDIDKYMADARLLFANIKDINDIDAGYSYLTDEQLAAVRQFWGDFLLNPKSESSLDKKRLFRDTWSILFPLYEIFRTELLSDGKAYEGMMYRIVAESLARDSSTRDEMLVRLRKYGRIVFVGLNALNKCEKRLLSTMRDSLGGDFYWDFEGSMVTDRDNKSSLFMKDNVTDYPSLHPLDPAAPVHQSIHVVSVPSAVAQTRVASRIIESLSAEDGFSSEETSLVLPDETLVIPMLNAIPECISDVNVTMGYPLSSSNLATFVSLLDRLHRNARVKEGRCGFYFRDVLSILEHPFVVMYARQNSLTDQIADIKSEIRRENVIFPSSGMLSGVGELFKLIFKKIDDVRSLSDYQISIMDELQEYVSRLDREFIYNYRTAVVRILNLGIQIKRETYFRLLIQLLSVITIPFRGEPLRGLQIMGPLETRALDFRNVIILSVNEGIFPKRSVSGSFIPYNIRLGFGLPNYEFQDSISAYHFYRSIYRAENVYLLFDSRSDGLQSGESSRYIKQMKYHFNVPLIEENVTYSLMSDERVDESLILKDASVMEELDNLFVKGEGRFSATSLNDYITCPFMFYYKHVRGVREEDEVAESLDSSLFGSIFHKVMEDIYSPFKGKVVNKEDIDFIISDKSGVDHMISSAFAEVAKITEFSGRNIIVSRLIRRFVHQTLLVDSQRCPFTIVGTEERMWLDMDICGGSRRVKLFGMADRMDRDSDGMTRIIDYKTGSVSAKGDFNDVAQMFDRTLDDRRPSIAFQLCIYSLLAVNSAKGRRAEDFLPTVYALREIFAGVPSGRCITTDELEVFRQNVTELLEEIFNDSVPFGASGNERSCKYCDFSKLCGR